LILMNVRTLTGSVEPGTLAGTLDLERNLNDLKMHW
jgi:hypothetical protein